jgi:hypothetical protein
MRVNPGLLEHTKLSHIWQELYSTVMRPQEQSFAFDQRFQLHLFFYFVVFNPRSSGFFWFHACIYTPYGQTHWLLVNTCMLSLGYQTTAAAASIPHAV